eukprot:COSAG06_NODE_182_length_20899_cov_89.175048_21_plen_96_part_00
MNVIKIERYSFGSRCSICMWNFAMKVAGFFSVCTSSFPPSWKTHSFSLGSARGAVSSTFWMSFSYFELVWRHIRSSGIGKYSISTAPVWGRITST